MKDLISILLIDDDEEDYLITSDIVEEIDHKRFTLDWVENYEKGLEFIRKGIHDVYLVDYRLGVQNGLDLILEAKSLGSEAPFILLTGLGDRKIDQQALEAGASDYIVKGTLTAERLERTIRYAMHEARHRMALQKLNQELEARVAERTREIELANEELRKSENLYRSIASNFPNGIIMVYDLDMNVVFADGKELIRLGLSKGELQGHHLSKNISPTLFEIISTELKPVFKGNERSFEVNFRGYDYLLRGVPLRDRHEGVERVLVVANNVTEQKKAAEEIKRALEQERLLNNLKSRFVSMASHEFRTPLSTIMSSVTLIGRYKDPAYEDKREKHINRIKNSVKNLNNILNDLLSIGKLEEGKVHVHPEKFNLYNFAQDIVEEHQMVAKRGQEISFSCECDRQEVVLDKHLLKNVFHNLISNAIKYSPEDKPIEVRMAVDEVYVLIKIIDQGMGIPLEEQEHLFERFFRAHNATNIQGTGLGLNIVKEYIQLMKGEISFESKLNEGTTFLIRLPLYVE
jgi:PAS domain S-box-containing protein